MLVKHIIIGSSIAGWDRAFRLLAQGDEVVLVEPGTEISATCVDLHDVSERFLKEACQDWPQVSIKAQSQNETVVLAWQQFVSNLTRAWAKDQVLMRSRFRRAGGTLLKGAVEIVDSQTVRVVNSRGQIQVLRSLSILIATGTRHDCPEFARENCSLVQQADRLLVGHHLPSECCVVGASLTGLRAACILTLWGCRVTIIDGKSDATELLEVCRDTEAENWFDWALELGVQFNWGQDVIGLAAGKTTVTLTLEAGGRLRTRFVWMATERLGRTDEFGMESTSMGVDNRGRLWCDSQGTTWEPTIQALGDIKSRVVSNRVLAGV